MKKLKFGIITTLTAFGIITASAAISPVVSEAANVRVTKSYRMDLNTVFNTLGNYHAYKYSYIPTRARYSGYSKYRVGAGWNYIRYERVNHFGKY